MTLDTDRFDAGSSHHPDIKFMVWDYYENNVAAYCDDEEMCERISRLLNQDSHIFWNGKAWENSEG